MSGSNSAVQPDDLLPEDVWHHDIHVGSVGAPVSKDTSDDFDPDDELQPVTSPLVIAMLGFDPKDLPE